MWRHPKYYKELRKRNNLDQAISDEASTEATSVRPGPGLKPQASSAKQGKLQAPSHKLQAPSFKRTRSVRQYVALTQDLVVRRYVLLTQAP